MLTLRLPALFQTQYRHLGGRDLRWPKDFRETVRNGHSLRPIDGIGDDAAANRAADFLTPQFAAICCVERVEIAAHVAEEHDASDRRRHAALDRIIGLRPPFPGARVGIDGGDPPSPVKDRVPLPQVLNGLSDASPDQGVAGAAAAIFSAGRSVTVVHHSTSPMKMRFICGS